MLIRNATAFLNGRFIPGVDVRLKKGRVVEVGGGLGLDAEEEVLNAEGDYLLPGFVDVHVHAFQGNDTMEGREAIRRMSRALYDEGVAAFLPTTMSASVEDTKRVIEDIGVVMTSPYPRSALVMGAHLEAPFLAESKCGAQVKEHFLNPSMDMLMELTQKNLGTVCMITMAPEKEGSEAFIREARHQGRVISLGHTAANGELTHQAADWGATHVTHTFNAQTPIHHRDPGVPGAALVDDRYYCEMICDGVHLHPDIVKLIVRAKGPEKAVMITDAMEAAGMPDGEYALGGQKVIVKNGEARLENGVLAGSVLTMKQALKNMIHRFGIAPEDAVRMCTLTPAESVEAPPMIGRIIPGSPAPLTLWSKDWQNMRVLG